LTYFTLFDITTASEKEIQMLKYSEIGSKRGAELAFVGRLKPVFTVAAGLFGGLALGEATGDLLYTVAGTVGSAVGFSVGWGLTCKVFAAAGVLIGATAGGIAGAVLRRDEGDSYRGAYIVALPLALIGAGVGGYYGYKIPKDLLIENYNKKKNASIDTSMNAQPVETALESAQQMAQAKGYRLSLA